MESDLDGRLEPVRFLAGTGRRLRILDALADGPRDRTALRETLAVPRTTLRRNLTELRERGWVARDAAADEYALTAAGRRARDAARAALADLETASETGTFLRALPASPPVEAADLDGIDVSVVADRDPHRPVRWLRSHIEASDGFRGFVPVVNPAYVSAVTDLLTEGFRMDLVGSESAYETIRRDYPDELETLRSVETLSLSVSTAVPDYGVALLDDHVFLTAYDGRMRPEAVARAAPEHPLGAWARRQYERVADTATPLAEWE